MRRWFTLKPSFRKVLSDLWGNKARTGLVVASIAVGVFAVGMIAGAYIIIPGDMNASYASANPASIEITTAPFDTDLLTSIKRVDGVQDAQASRTLNVRLQTGPDRWTSFDLIAISDFSPNRINNQLQLSGMREPAKNEVILERRTAQKYGLKAGDVLTIELPDNATRQMAVAGVSQDVTSGIGGLFNETRGFIQYDTIEWLHAPAYYNQLLITVSGPGGSLPEIQQVADEVTNKLNKSGRETYQTTLQEKNLHPMNSILQALLRILLVLGVLIVFLSGSLISNTLTSLLNQHLQQIGIMKLVGARSGQIRRMYLALILAFGGIALLVGVPAGSWAAYALSAFAANLIGFPLRGFRIIPQAVVIQVLIALAVPVLAGTPSILRSARITVQKALSGGSLAESLRLDKSLLDRLLARLKGFSRPALVSIRNTFRQKGRLALTLFTLTLGGAIFISVFNVQVSLNDKINQITKYFGADINLDFAQPYATIDIQPALEGIAGIKKVEPWAMSSADLLGEDNKSIDSLTLIAPPAGSEMVKPILQSGRWIEAGDQAAITVNDAFVKKYPGTKVGDRLNLKIAGHKAGWLVVGIFQFTGKDDLVGYTNYDTLSNLLDQTNRTASYRISTNDHSLAFQTQLSRTIDTYFRDQGYKIRNVEAGGAFTRSVTEYIAILTGFLVIMALLTAAVGSIGMAGTLSMNVLERTREIGVLRAIGAYDTVIMRLVLVEGLIIGAISFGFGALLSFPITTVLSEVISQAIFNSPASYAFTPQGFLIWLGLVVLLSALASFIPARAASRMTIREVLSYE